MNQNEMDTETFNAFFNTLEQQPGDFLADFLKVDGLEDLSLFPASPPSSDSPPSPSTVTTPPSSAEDSPPSSLLQDNFLQDLFVPNILPALDGCPGANQSAEFINFDDIQLTPSKPAAATSPDENSSGHESSVGGNRKTKKTLPHGQTTLPIKITTQKASRPRRKLECYNCKVTKTPLWRRTPDRVHTLCNACGLYYKQYNQHRPLHVRQKTYQGTQLRAHPYGQERVLSSSGNAAVEPMMSMIATLPLLQPQQQRETKAASSSAETSQGSSSGIECANCHQTQTPLWRKNDRGQPVCNACGLYSRLHHRDRPIEMRKAKIQRRRRDWAVLENEEVGNEWEEQPEAKQQQQQQQPDANVIATFPAASSTDLEEDTRFLSLLVQMNKDQMQGFLGMLERRCDILRAVLGQSTLNQQQVSCQ